MNRKESRAFTALLELIDAGVEYPDAEWKASENGCLIDASRLRDLYDLHCADTGTERHRGERGGT